MRYLYSCLWPPQPVMLRPATAASTSEIPIILLSAKAQNADVRTGLEAGADDYVTKPFEPLDLVDRVNRLLETRASKRS